MNEPYMLKYPVNDEALECLNRLSRNHLQPKVNYHAIGGVDEIEDWIDALESGKKIVNPMSPREELKKLRDKYKHYGAVIRGTLDAEWLINRVVEIVAKDPKHSDVKDWLKEGEADA